MATSANGLAFNSDGNKIFSDTPIPPGEHLEEEIEYIRMTERSLPTGWAFQHKWWGK